MPTRTYKSAPISEVSFGMGFAALPGFKVSHYGLFWEQIREDYPETEDQAPLIVPEELKTFTFASGKLLLPRAWYVHRDRSVLIQLQSNRIWLNWRRLDASTEYPHFATLAEQFRCVTRKLRELLRGVNAGLLTPTGYELAYVNQIPTGALWSRYADVGNFMRDVKWNSVGRSLPVLDAINWATTFTVGDVQLVADLKAGKEQAPPQRPVFTLDIRARSTVASPGSALGDDDFQWYDRAHDLVNTAFDDLTTLEAQRVHWLSDNPSR